MASRLDTSTVLNSATVRSKLPHTSGKRAFAVSRKERIGARSKVCLRDPSTNPLSVKYSNRLVLTSRSSPKFVTYAIATPSNGDEGDSNSQAPGTKTDCGEGLLQEIPCIGDWIPDLPYYDNPMLANDNYNELRNFVEEDEVIVHSINQRVGKQFDGDLYYRAGPRREVRFNPSEVRAAIVTCGGLCPGLNTVVREIVLTLWFLYGVRDIVGISNGYRGFYSENMITLNPDYVDSWHRQGGTILGTSRGGADINKIVDSIQVRGINQVYIIGGDGTQRGANAIYTECKKRGLKVAVAGIPKTIDNDVSIIDKSFGFDTSVEEAQRAINAAHVEATSTPNGVGLVKLMGRHAGFIAMHSSLASRDVDCCLIPEVPFFLEGRGGLVEFLIQRLRSNNHAVIVVAEGAGQNFVHTEGTDASGNQTLADVGLWLATQLKEKCADIAPIQLKYIDPTYMIRAIPANASDNVYCTVLAQSAVHGAFAGYTGFMVGPVNGRHVFLPIQHVVKQSASVDPQERMWARLMASTGQPGFKPQQRLQSQESYKPKELDLKLSPRPRGMS
mmetsp:Transcript_23289/g.28140  ORF Transcript_23289/g.28140 Transcript_23289/m.28140 type:complete len:558 (+) Transcript_23289:99-1772(+)|eukprot:CAMPEP_0197852754 /NCGR_PEP_ID=MMETSP1438-20131217/21298_1 /TAXON_ID=1461541 /ORGANISM="Pterosperma sp., Strain CCMP1384" /LENGTH=557 /DNA_ID=CAMNT_0043466919 /DNA_START=92 /DNA_END=1765 /DNA_ORIENTATION=+